MPPTTSCPHCGAPLEPLTVVVNGKEMRVATRPCPCPGAAAERAELERREADEERARLMRQAARRVERAGIPRRYAEAEHPKAQALSARVLAGSGVEADEERARLMRQAARRVERAGIPRRYAEAEHPKAQALSARVLAGSGVYLHGSNGTGKTHLACAAALLCLGRGVDVRFAVVPSLLEGIRSRSKDAGETVSSLSSCGLLVLDDLGKEAACGVDVRFAVVPSLLEGIRSRSKDAGETVSSLSSCGLLVLDDLGKEAACTPYAAERLFDIVNERYNAKLPVIVTSNFTRGEVARRISEGEVGVAIASRLAEMTASVHLDGADRRIHG